MITLTCKGNFNKIDKFLNGTTSLNITSILEKYAQEGVSALRENTPVKSGKTANSWNYTISNKKGKLSITWTNSNIVDGVPIAILIQYGHGTKNGGYVRGLDYINPALKPIFNNISNDIWTEVSRL